MHWLCVCTTNTFVRASYDMHCIQDTLIWVQLGLSGCAEHIRKDRFTFEFIQFSRWFRKWPWSSVVFFYVLCFLLLTFGLLQAGLKCTCREYCLWWEIVFLDLFYLLQHQTQFACRFSMCIEINRWILAVSKLLFG